jgi:hypothetical protein
MKILYLTYPKHDYLADQIYTGLCKLLGWENVTDFPYKPYYHDPSYRVPSLPQNPGCRFELDEIITRLERNEYDLLVLSTSRRETVEAFESIWGRANLPPRVLIDGDDHPHIRKDLFKGLGLSLYFKREYRLSWCEDGLSHWTKRWSAFGWDRELFQRTFPLPFSINLETVPCVDEMHKDLDLSFVGLISNRNRIRAVNFLRTVPDIRFEGWVYAEPTDRRSKLALGTFSILKEKIKGDPRISESERGVKLSYHEYFNLLRRSRIALSVPGSGFDTLRYWEIVAARVLLISEKPFIVIPNNFKHGEHALFCRSDYRDVPEFVKIYTRDDVTREQMIDAAYQHLLRFHTCERRATQFLEVCQKNI